MQNNLSFTVICPTYNSENFIKKNIFSLLNQKYKNFEVIYSDDGSTDKTLQILRDHEILFIKQKIGIKILANHHKGPGAARNKGIKLSNFNWVSFIDSDDQWTEDKLERVSKSIKQSKNYNCIVHNEIFKKKNGGEIQFNYKKFFNPHKPIFSQLFLKNFLSTSSMTMKKKLIIKANYFDEELQNAQDYDLWLKIGDNFNFHFIDEYLGFYNERNDNITSRPYNNKIVNLLKILRRNKENVSRLFYYYKFLRILISKEWFK
ncbi:MAG: hypothetical protein CMM99_04960 [Rickettsiales bacterium]|nr:hypothetical protein [Rickettsiales bacterium]|tara:strand:- start:197 stop:979 length:783 start_codon:yes stop_codon:yes gene_type:complete